MRRHPQISDLDVRNAIRSMLCYMQRGSGEYLAVGIDSKGRLIELVYQYSREDDYFFVFHGMTPPSQKTLRELGLA